MDELIKKGYLNHDTYSKPNGYYEEESTDDLQNMVITEAVAIPRNNVGSIFLVRGEHINYTNLVTNDNAWNHENPEEKKNGVTKPMRIS